MAVVNSTESIICSDDKSHVLIIDFAPDIDQPGNFAKSVTDE